MIKIKKKYTISEKAKDNMKSLAKFNHKGNKRKVDSSGKHVIISLNKGKTTIIDAEDYNKIKMYTWRTFKCKNTCYVTSDASVSGGLRKKTLLLHRLILDLKRGISVDHINGDGLDNRRNNLRIATKQQNGFNRNKNKERNGKKCSSKYKGVGWHTRDKLWYAQNKNNYKMIHLGYFKSEEEAARAYDRKAKELFGEYAKLNFPKG